IEAAKAGIAIIEEKMADFNGSEYADGSSYRYGDLITVREVIDGDTIILENGDKVRYIGIDTPELDDNSKGVECYSVEATQENRNLVKDKKVRLYKDTNERDRYGRLLAYVYR